MKKIILPILFLLCFLAPALHAQEFNFSVTINTKQVAGTDQRVYDALQEAVTNFMNNQVWTNIRFEEQERIEGTMVIVMKDKVENHFTAELNITSLLAFYAYYSLGLYFDTFGLYGGDQMYKAAEQVVTQAQSSAEAGWKAFDSYKNRYWLLESFTNPAYRQVRQFLYEYHRLGLDVMGNGKVDDGRAAMTKSLECVKSVYNSKPNLYYFQILNDTKRDEWKNVYSEGPQQERTKAVNFLRELDPTHSEEYEELLNAKKKF